MSGKRCTGCGEVKAVGAFSRDRSKKDGLKPRCKACNRRYYEENREADIERSRRYYEENREALAERNRRYYEENREAALERTRRYREEYREALAEDQRRWRESMRDMTREAATRHREPYAPAEDAHILASDEPAAVIAVELGRTMKSVEHRRRRLRKAVGA